MGSARISCRLPQLFILFLLGAATLLGVHLIVLPALKGRRIPNIRRQQPTTYRCNQLTQTYLPSIGQEFQFLSSHPSNRDLFTYSAYFDPRDSSRRPVVRVVGIAVGGRVSGPLCQLWYRRSDKMTAAAPAAVEVAPEGDGRLYESVVISCEILGEDGEVPYAVSFASSACAQPNGAHLVQRLPSEPVRNGKFSVCVSPLHLNYNRVDEMVQTLEMNRLLGADHFFVYNHTSSQQVTRMLGHKQFASDVTVLQFQTPVKSVQLRPHPASLPIELKYFGQMAAVQDCVMRAATRYEFAVFTDMDEVIVPRGGGHRSWRDLTRAFMSDNKTAGLSFQHAVFWLEWPSDPVTSANVTISSLRLSFLLKLQREAEIYTHGSQAKLIVRPHFVRIMSVHNVESYFQGRATAYVDYNSAGLQHYRSWADRGEQRKATARDPGMLRFREQLIGRVQRARNALALPVG